MAHVLAGCCLLLAATLAACGNDSGSTLPTAISTDAADAGLRVLVDPAKARPGETIGASVVNGTDTEFSYGAGYELERQMGNSFEKVKLPVQPVIQIAYVAKPGETGPPVMVKVPKNSLAGQYRVVISRDAPDVGDLSGEFEVVGGN